MNIGARIKKTNDCWVWTGELTGSGYGRVRIKGKNFSAHRYVFELLIKPVPEGLQIDHLCRNRTCVNPRHLEPVTGSENVKRAWAVRIKDKLNCPKGHPYSGDNLYILTDRKNGQTWRNCKMCRVETNKKYYYKKRANL